MTFLFHLIMITNMMTHKKPHRTVDTIVFWTLMVAGFLLYGEAMYQYGKIHGTALKCAFPSLVANFRSSHSRGVPGWSSEGQGQNTPISFSMRS